MNSIPWPLVSGEVYQPSLTAEKGWDNALPAQVEPLVAGALLLCQLLVDGKFAEAASLCLKTSADELKTSFTAMTPACDEGEDDGDGEPVEVTPDPITLTAKNQGDPSTVACWLYIPISGDGWNEAVTMNVHVGAVPPAPQAKPTTADAPATGAAPATDDARATKAAPATDDAPAAGTTTSAAPPASPAPPSSTEPVPSTSSTLDLSPLCRMPTYKYLKDVQVPATVRFEILEWGRP